MVYIYIMYIYVYIYINVQNFMDTNNKIYVCMYFIIILLARDAATKARLVAQRKAKRAAGGVTLGRGSITRFLVPRVPGVRRRVFGKRRASSF